MSLASAPCTMKVATKVRTRSDMSLAVPMAVTCSRRPCELDVRVGVEADSRRHAGTQRQSVDLVDARAHPHRLWVDDLQEGDAGADLVALLDLGHLGALPDRVENHDALDGRAHEHPLRVAFRVLHGALGAVSPDLEHPELGEPDAFPRLLRLPELSEPSLGLLEVLLVLLGVDPRDDLVPLRLEGRNLHGVLRRLELRGVRGARGRLLRLLLLDLLDEVAVLRLPVEERSKLALPVELGEDVAGLDAGARLGEAGDHEGETVGSRETRRGDGLEAGGLDDSMEAEDADEIAPLDSRPSAEEARPRSSRAVRGAAPRGPARAPRGRMPRVRPGAGFRGSFMGRPSPSINDASPGLAAAAVDRNLA